MSKLDNADMQLSQEQEAWTREKVLLEKALHLAQSQVARLKGEIRTDNLREITGPEADNALLKVRHSECNAVQHVSKEFNTSQALTVLFLNTSLFLPSPEDLWEIPEVRKFPQSSDLPEEVSAITAGRLPGV